MRVRVFDREGKLGGPVESAHVTRSDAEWRARLTPEQYQVTRGKGTERPFCGTLLDNKREGVYACVCGGLGPSALRLERKIQSRHRLADLLSADRTRKRENRRRSEPRHGARGDPLYPVRRPPGPRLRGRPGADRSALLREFGVPHVHRGGGAGPARRSRRGVTALPNGRLSKEPAMRPAHLTRGLPLLAALPVLLWSSGAAPVHSGRRTLVDHGLARTPPMGWNSWNHFGCDVSARLIRETADAIVASGMRDAGYQYVVIEVIPAV